ncbi:MAG TPA: ribosome biogenesis GTPase Der [Polyangiales bacterium]|jgi:GTP-binding protein|nr:ribosome biogenesis GTPase Der [Polyangiales bacterium]
MSGRRRAHARRPAGSIINRPLVAIVGRPNVGKSTLFNRLAGQHIAIVEDIPGVTRDRHYADAFALGREIVLIDTGGFDPDSDDPMKAGIASQVRLALEECDLVVCVVDATVDPLPADREAVALLRDAGKPVIFVANKADSREKEHDAVSYYELGIDSIMPISALHGRGIGDLEEEIANQLPEPVEIEDPELDVPRVAIIGRPNAGKSSLVNQLCGEERQLVDNRPGTTVDSVDTLIDRDGNRLILIDTAGIRRKRSVKKQGVEGLSVLQAIRSIERSHVVVLMIDGEAGVGEQDAKIAGLAHDRGRALVLALNKTDLMSRDEQKKAMDRTREVLAFAPWAPLVSVSALEGKGINALLGRVVDAVEEHRKRIGTAEMNRFFEEVLDKHPPPTMHHRPVRLYYITQASVAPPTFVVMTNSPDDVHFSYQRYVVNQIRQRFGFKGTPIRVRYRGKKKK